jgi:tight adherence protein B
MSFAELSSHIQSVLMVLMPVAGMMLVFYSGYQLWNDLRNIEQKRIRDRLKDERIRQKSNVVEQNILRQLHGDNKFYEKLLNQISLTRKLQRWIDQADFDFSAPKTLLYLGIGSAAILAVGFLLNLKLWLVMGVALTVFFLPVLVLRFLARRRMNKLVYQLPDVFQLIGQALRAGHSLASGIQLVGTQLPDPSGTEFHRVFHEQNLGIKIEDALSNLADRVGELDVRFFVTAVLIQRQTGGDLAEVLDKIGAVIRERITILGQVKALTAEGRMSGWVLSALPFVVFFVAWMLNPDYANVLLKTPQGQHMLMAAGVFQVIGMLMIKKIVNIKV